MSTCSPLTTTALKDSVGLCGILDFGGPRCLSLAELAPASHCDGALFNCVENNDMFFHRWGESCSQSKSSIFDSLQFFISLRFVTM